jgi:hypothetical protein
MIARLAYRSSSWRWAIVVATGPSANRWANTRSTSAMVCSTVRLSTVTVGPLEAAARWVTCCQPRGRDIPDGHPPTIWLPERDLLTGLTQFLNARILGPDRVALVERSITAADKRAAEAPGQDQSHQAIDRRHPNSGLTA